MPSKELIASVIKAIAKNPPKVTRVRDMETLEYSETVDHAPTAEAAISTILAAIAEADTAMLDAGCKAWGVDINADETRENIANEWRQMLDASALGEQSE